LVGEAATVVRERLAGLDHDPAREAEVSQRVADARALARKHRVDPDALPALQARLEGELDSITHGETRRAELIAALEAANSALHAAAAALTSARQAAAARLGQQVTEQMQALGMPGGRFEVELPLREHSAHGAETVAFVVAANPGQAGGPLARVASGGELSRISLALQVAAREKGRAATLIFDEVDTGVGGRVAEMVGQQLHALAGRGQVLCVTHLPQVASQADHHFRVSKHTDGSQTTTAVLPLDQAERVEELARMLGGLKITQRTRDHAREMLAAADVREAG
jgi:DNA repair protein RecN (Recombination protein N)